LVFNRLLLLTPSFAPYLTKVIDAGFWGDKHEMVTNLMRVMLAIAVFLRIEQLGGGILNSFKNFLVLCHCPDPLQHRDHFGRCSIWCPRFGYMGLAYGVDWGAFLHMIIQAARVFALGIVSHAFNFADQLCGDRRPNDPRTDGHRGPSRYRYCLTRSSLIL